MSFKKLFSKSKIQKVNLIKWILKLIVEIKVVTNLNEKLIVEVKVKVVTNLFKLENPFVIKLKSYI